MDAGLTKATSLAASLSYRVVTTLLDLAKLDLAKLDLAKCQPRLNSAARLFPVPRFLPVVRCSPAGAGWSGRGSNSQIADFENRSRAAFHKLWSVPARPLCIRPSRFAAYLA